MIMTLDDPSLVKGTFDATKRDAKQNTDNKSVTITGLNGMSGELSVYLYATMTELTAVGTGTIANNSVTISLMEYTNYEEESGNPWNGTGNYSIQINTEETMYIYTADQTWIQLGIDIEDPDEDAFSKLPKYNITSVNSTIPLSQFAEFAPIAPDPEPEESKINTITITELDSETNTIYFNVFASTAESGDTAKGEGIISGSSAAIPLVTVEDNTPWTGTGSYYLYFFFAHDTAFTTYFYTNGQTLEQLGITNEEEMNEAFYAKLPKYDITSAESIIPFSQFAEFAIPTAPDEPEMAGVR